MKSLSTKIIGLIIGVLVVGAGIYAFTNSQSDENYNENAASSQNQTADEASDSSPTFAPMSAEDVSYVATISGTSDGQSVQGTIESDGQGNSKFSFDQGEEGGELYVTSEATYSCSNNEGCFRFSRDSESTPGLVESFDSDRYDYNQEEFDAFKDRAIYESRQLCPAGTCDVWSVVDENDHESTIYIDVQNNRVSQVESRDETSDIKLVYEYRDVTITPPENAQEIPAF